VIPALIRKCVEAKERGDDQIEVWGDGSASREFLYVDDAAAGLMAAAEAYNSSEPVNLGTGHEMTIAEIVARVKACVGFTGRVVWDASKPNGQPRRRLDTERARREFGFVARTPFDAGLRATVDWYLESRRQAAAPAQHNERV